MCAYWKSHAFVTAGTSIYSYKKPIRLGKEWLSVLIKYLDNSCDYQ